MRAIGSFLRFVVLGAAVAIPLGGCVHQTTKRVAVTEAIHAEREIPPEELLNVDVAVFDTGVEDPIDAAEDGLFPEVREAEARFVPVQLRRTLQKTGHWGAVRVVPAAPPFSELLVTGTILHSDGETLSLRVRAVDASGREWLAGTYEEEAAQLSYTERAVADFDPFQDVYNRIANDLLEARRERTSGDLAEIQRLGFLRFAADLSPAIASPWLEESSGRYRAVGLPARDDPNVARIERIRERDFAFVDALDQHYGLFESAIGRQYDEWRAASYREVVSLEKLRGQALGRTVLGAAGIAGGIAGLAMGAGGMQAAASGLGMVGGGALLKSGFDKRSESTIHADALKELGESLERDVKPRIVELEGRTVTLTGSAEAQYEEWRRLLHGIYAEETGFAIRRAETTMR